MFTDEQIEDLINNFYGGIYTRRNLPPELYADILDHLTDAITKGMGFGIEELNNQSDDIADLFLEFRHNAGVFSSAKVWQMANDMVNVLFVGIKKVTIEVFRKQAGEIFNLYNKVWLKTEFETSFASSQMGSQWIEFQEDKEDFPLLQYQTAGDERVRHSHNLLDNIVRPVTDPFWTTHLPPNGYNCRCTVIQLEAGDAEITELKNAPDPDKGFNFNAGKREQIFPKSHPYFKIPKRFISFAKTGFGLNIPAKPQ